MSAFRSMIEAVGSMLNIIVSSLLADLETRISYTYPLQLSHLKGKKSSRWQKAIWQCRPIASTSPCDMLVKLSEPVTSVDAEEDILSNREANFYTGRRA